MATLFDLIYGKFLETVNSNTLALLSEEDMKEILYTYLDRVVALEFKQCKKDLSKIIEPENYSLSFDGDGINKNFVILKAPIEKSELFAEISGVLKVQDVDFIYDSTTNAFSFITPPEIGVNNVKVGWKFCGAFENDLDKEEQWIIALSMSLAYLEPKVKEERLLSEAIGDRDYNVQSHGSQLKQLLELEKTTRSNLEKYILSYTYNDFEGFS